MLCGNNFCHFTTSAAQPVGHGPESIGLTRKGTCGTMGEAFFAPAPADAPNFAAKDHGKTTATRRPEPVLRGAGRRLLRLRSGQSAGFGGHAGNHRGAAPGSGRTCPQSKEGSPAESGAESGTEAREDMEAEIRGHLPERHGHAVPLGGRHDPVARLGRNVDRATARLHRGSLRRAMTVPAF